MEDAALQDSRLFREQKKRAELSGWKVPQNDAMPRHAWRTYWASSAAYEKDKSLGRPVVPHRSA